MSLPAPPSGPATPASLLQAADNLLAWQQADRPESWPQLDPALLRRGLDDFAQHYLAPRQAQLAPAMLALVPAAFDALLAQLAAEPLAPLHSPTDAQQACLGPVSWAIAALTRNPALPWDEELALDVTVRYWQKARPAGLPVPEDFGEFYKAVEWSGLQQHLAALGHWAQQPEAARPQAILAALLRSAHGTAERYRELKALARLIEQAEGVQQASGYAFGRV